MKEEKHVLTMLVENEPGALKPILSSGGEIEIDNRAG